MKVRKTECPNYVNEDTRLTGLEIRKDDGIVFMISMLIFFCIGMLFEIPPLVTIFPVLLITYLVKKKTSNQSRNWIPTVVWYLGLGSPKDLSSPKGKQIFFFRE